jgi:hypothetical protein
MKTLLLLCLSLLASPAAAADPPRDAQGYTRWRDLLALKKKKKAKLARPMPAAQRDAMLRTAHLWHWVDPAQADLRNGPDFGPVRLDPNARVSCRHIDEPSGGTTPKFKCRGVGGPLDGKKLKVKFHPPGVENGELFTEVAGSRLLWALGFGADFVYPVRAVECAGCSANPFAGGNGPEQRHVFYDVSIELKLGKAIEARDAQGWSWKELDGPAARTLHPHAATARRRARAHKDALKLLMVLLRHYDNKPENQRLVCLPGGITKKGKCRWPHLNVQDIGATFGPGWKGNGPAIAKWWRAHSVGRPMGNKYFLDGWARQPIWRDPVTCVADLEKWISAEDGLRHPQISEAGRAFLAHLLRRLLLNPQGVEALFEGARFSTPRRWAQVFRQKARAVIEHRCPLTK